MIHWVPFGVRRSRGHGGGFRMLAEEEDLLEMDIFTCVCRDRL